DRAVRLRDLADRDDEASDLRIVADDLARRTGDFDARARRTRGLLERSLFFVVARESGLEARERDDLGLREERSADVRREPGCELIADRDGAAAVCLRSLHVARVAVEHREDGVRLGEEIFVTRGARERESHRGGVDRRLTERAEVE